MEDGLKLKPPTVVETTEKQRIALILLAREIFEVIYLDNTIYALNPA